MSSIHLLLCIKFILAFCSMSYELILAQGLSAFLENTVLRYSVTIGLYLCSMGFGAMLADRRLSKNKYVMLLKIEVLLTILGGLSLGLLHMMDFLNFPRLFFMLLSHLLIIAIGVLTGLELPTLMGMVREIKKERENTVLAADYIGAFAATIIFVFFFFPVLGLVATAFLTALLNAVCGLILFTQESRIPPEDKPTFYKYLYIQTALFFFYGLCLLYVPYINRFFLNLYLN